MPRFFNPPTVWKPFGAFSMGVVQGDGRVVHLKGQVPLDPDGNIVGHRDMHQQTRKVLENIRDVLAHVGGEMKDVLSLTHYVTDIRAFMTTGALRREFFAEPYPTTTTVEVTRLYHRDILVEITAVAEIPRERFKEPA